MLTGEAPTLAHVGDEVTVDFQVTNIGSATTGADIVVETNRDDVTCRIAAAIAPDGTAECQATITVTRADLALIGSDIVLVATAKDGDNHSNDLLLEIQAHGTVTVGFEETQVTVTEGPDAEAALKVNIAGGRQGNIDVAYELSPKIDKPAMPGEDYDGSSGTLTFGTDDTEKTISIPIYQDEIDEAREKFTVTLTASGGAVVDPDRATAVVTIVDEYPGNDDPYVPRASVYFNHDGPVPESAGSAEFVVRLDRPSGRTVDVDRNLTFQGTATIGTDYVGPTVRSVIIPPGETEATFSVVIFDDEENEDDETFEVRITRGQYGLIDSSANTATGTIADDDDVLSTAITLGVSRDTVPEGEEITVTVTAELDADPLDTDITVPVSVDDDSREANAADASDFDAIAPFEIVISAGQTSGSQTFQLNAVDDDLDETDETIVLQGGIADENEADALPVTPVTLTITDDDTRGITVNPLIISLEESGEGSFYRIRLDSMPTDTVTIRIEPEEGAHLSVNPSEMTFTQENWNRGRRVNVRAMEDGDTEINSLAYIGHSVSGGDYGDVTAADVSVRVTDMTVPEITVSPARGSEGSGELEFLVTVNPSISRIVDVQYELIDETAEAGSDYTKPEGGAQTLRFLHGQTRKTIRVPVTDDGVDEEDEETFLLRLTDISDHANFSGGASTIEVRGTIEDNDATPVASVNGPGGAISFVPESVGAVTFTITLEGSASEVVSVDYSTGNLSGAISGRAGGIVNAIEDEDYTGVEGTVEFQPGETTKTVTVSVTNDNVSEALEYFGFHISNPRNAYLKQTGASAAILDNDPKRVVVTPTSLMLAEGGDAGSYTVRLATEPTENVTVTIGGYAGTDVSVDETSLTFTPEDWETEQPVEVTAREDDDAVNDTVTLTHTVGGGDYEGLDADGVTVTVTDNDTAGLVLSETALTITEGDSAEYTVKLASEPADTVQVSFGIPAGSELTTEPRSLIFTVDNWNDEQRVEVTSHQDDDAVDDVAAITHMPVGGDYGPAHNADLTITVTDQDTPGLTISPATLTVDEGSTADYTVRLDTEPTETVTVTIAGEGDVSVEPDTLTFSVSEWNYGQTVTAKAGPDDDVTNDSATLSHTASGGDYGTVSEDLPVTVTDNSAEIVLSESAITVDEEGEDVSYTVKLAAEPTGPVIVTITGASETILSLEDDSLTFTVDDWDSEQEVIVSADHDDDGSVDEFTLTHTASNGDYDSAPVVELQVTVTDNDTADVIILETALTIDEGGDGTYTVKLKTEPTGEVTVTVNDPSNTDVTAEPESLTFTTETWNNAQPVTVSAKEDDDDTADEAATVTHTVSGADYEDVTAADVEVTVIDNDDPQVTVSFGAASYTVAEGGTVEVTVTLSADPKREVVIPLTATEQDGATGADYSDVPESVTFESGDTSKTFTFEAADDTLDDDGESVKLGFGTLPAGVTAGDTAESTVAITDDDKPASVTVNFEQDSYTVAEGGTVTVKVTLSDDPEMTVTVPLTATEQDGATTADYSGVPANLTFNSGDTEKEFTFGAEADEVDDDGESVKLGFGALPAGVASGATAESTVSITDDDDPQVTVSFGAASYTVAEGGTVEVTVTLSADPEREVVIPLTATEQDGATGSDYSDLPESVTFESGDTEKTSTFEATDDTLDDDGESVKLGFGAMPAGVTSGDTAESTVSITDDDKPASVTVNFDKDSYTVAEGGTVTVKVTLSDDPEMTVTVPLTATEQDGATTADYSNVPASLTFNSGDTEKEFTFGAEADEVDDDGESVKLAFGTLPAGVAAGDTAESTVAITDDDDPGVRVSFGAASYTVAEGGTVEVTVTLSADPEREVVIPLTKYGHEEAAVDTNFNGSLDDYASSATDYSGVPESVTFESGDTSKTFTFEATDDALDDDGESVKLGFGAMPAGVTSGDTAESTVSITDDDKPASVTVNFDKDSYTVAEGGTVTVKVTLSDDPEMTVTVPLTATEQDGATTADYSNVPASLTFESGDTEKEFTFGAEADEVDDDGESVKLGFGTLPAGVASGDTAESTVSITDDDKPASVTVNFDKDSYTVAEGGTVTVKVTLSDDPEMTVTVPLTATEQDGATTADYSDVPASLTFDSEDTEKEFTFGAEVDEVDDDGESVKLGFGTLPAGVTAGDTAESTVSITDDDDPQVTVSFGASSYTAAEGGTVEVTVTLSADPERQVVIPLTKYGREEAAVDTNFNGSLDDYASSATDYSGVPESVTFESGDTSKTFTFEATDDALDDDGENVKLGFGAMPTGVTVDTTIPDGETQARDTATVAITDDDKPASVTVNFDKDSYTVAEGGTVTVKVTLSDDPEMTVTVPLTATEQGGATTADYSDVPASLTFESGDTEKEFTFGAEADDVDDDGESVKLGFGALPAGVTAGDTAESTVSITDDDDPQVTVSFGASAYTAAEGGTVEVTVDLSADPEREVVIPLTKYGREEAAVDTNFNGSLDDYASSATDYSGVPESVTFESGDTSKTFTFEATDDALDDDGESVKLGFGAMPTGVTVDTTIPDGETQARDTATVSINDDDDPQVTVSFGASSYTAAEGGTVEVTVTLSADPEREVVIPLTTTEQDGATGADYSDVPESVTFESGDTSKTFTFEATDDALDDDGESVKLGFGAMPAGVTAGDTAESTVSITDNDDPGVMVNFGSATYSATEGGDDAEITVYLSVPAPGQVDIPLTATGHYKATPDDWLGVPTVLTFDTGDTSKSFTLVAFDDTVEDDGEMVELGFGTLPDGFVAGSPATAKVTLMNDDAVQADLTVEPDGLTDFATLCGDTRATLTIGTPFEGRLGFSDDIDAIKVAFTAGSNGYRVSLRNEDNEQISAEDFYIGMVHPDDGWMHYVSYDYLTNWETERDTLFIIPEQTGTYCVEVRAKSERFTGDYSVLARIHRRTPMDGVRKAEGG